MRRWPENLLDDGVAAVLGLGLDDAKLGFWRLSRPVLDALVCADMTTGPAGQTYNFDERMDEILRRYPPESPVHRAITNSRPSWPVAWEGH
jgi:hypothetical protein